MGNFIFLKSHWEDLSNTGELAENYVFSDPNTSMIKQGMFAERLVQYMLAYDGIEEPSYDNTHSNRIKLLNTDDKHPEKTFSDNWKKYGFQIDSNRISLISIAIYDPDSDAMFVGHTGVLIKYSDYYLFVEKIAFEQPYQATKVNNMDELLSILSLRPEYFGEEKEAGPFVYNNGDYVGTLELQSAEL